MPEDSKNINSKLSPGQTSQDSTQLSQQMLNSNGYSAGLQPISVTGTTIPAPPSNSNHTNHKSRKITSKSRSNTSRHTTNEDASAKRLLLYISSISYLVGIIGIGISMYFIKDIIALSLLAILITIPYFIVIQHYFPLKGKIITSLFEFILKLLGKPI